MLGYMSVQCAYTHLSSTICFLCLSVCSSVCQDYSSPSFPGLLGIFQHACMYCSGLPLLCRHYDTAVFLRWYHSSSPPPPLPLPGVRTVIDVFSGWQSSTPSLYFVQRGQEEFKGLVRPDICLCFFCETAWPSFPEWYSFKFGQIRETAWPRFPEWYSFKFGQIDHLTTPEFTIVMSPELLFLIPVASDLFRLAQVQYKNVTFLLNQVR
jgi:hypothetical protein